jgi:hypothetical protein
MNFGGIDLNKIWSRGVVVVIKMVLVCKMPKWVGSTLCLKVATCLIYIGQTRQSQP